MYYCRECGAEFSEPKLYTGDTYEFWGAVETEKYAGCPECESEDIIEVKAQCACCGDFIAKGEQYYETFDDLTYCTACIKLKGGR